MKKKPTFSLKDQLFNEEKVTLLAEGIQQAYPDFNSKNFITETIQKFPELELKERIAWIREQLYAFLPKEYPKAVEIIVSSLPEKLDPTKSDNDFGDFIYAPLSDYVAQYGKAEKHLEKSLHALQQITMRFSAEDAIRYFINAFPEKTVAALQTWASHENYHVRRLVSEGTRPKLPWSQKIVLDAKTAIPLLDSLFSDSTRYVTRSVANHINDISKINPTLAISTLQKWQKSGKQQPAEMVYIIKHSLRTLVKLGNKQALEMLGFSAEPAITVSECKVSHTKIAVGETLEFSFEIIAESDANLLVDYILYFQNKNGEMKNKKVHKITQLTLKKGERQTIHKKHPLRAMTTRSLYPGKHKVEIQINGKIFQSFEFELVV